MSDLFNAPNPKRFIAKPLKTVTRSAWHTVWGAVRYAFDLALAFSAAFALGVLAVAVFRAIL